MFTGIIETLGRVVENQSLKSGCRLMVRSDFQDIMPGESIAVNGVCLTALAGDGKYLAFDISLETLRLTTLGVCTAGQPVHLERALLAGTRMGGHYVSGHVDTTAVVQSIRMLDDFVECVIGEFGAQALPYLWPKGSITLDGVSLTINAVIGDSITVMLVPHTLANTTFGSLKVGSRMNVEFDYLARIILHQMEMIQLRQNPQATII